MGPSPSVQTVAAPAPPPEPPSYDTSAITGRQAADELRKRRGTQANVKTTDSAAPMTMASKLLGA